MSGRGQIELPEEAGCAFCAYLAGERAYTILDRHGLVATLVTREQRGVSHLLVIPTRHVATILDLTDEESAALMVELRDAARLIDRAEQCRGIAVWQNNGVDANQAIGHVHFHVAGTLATGGTRWDEVPEVSVEETDEIARRLRAASED